MKAEVLKERPNYELLKQSDIVNFYHLQLPRWLMDDSKYMSLSLEGKFTYTLLFNRFQLSKHNGWVNENGEVFVIYTRKDLAKNLNISEKRISTAMNELRDYNLIWERRCGRGFANQIYLAYVKLNNDEALQSKGSPLDPADAIDDEEIRTDDMAGLGELPIENEMVSKSKNKCDKYTISRKNNHSSSSTTFVPFQEPSKEAIMNRQNVHSRADVSAVLEPPKSPSIYKELKEIDLTYYNQSQSMSSPSYGNKSFQKHDLTDSDIIEKLIRQSDADVFSDDEAEMLKDAIERLYFMQSIKINNAVYSQERIRSHLWRLDGIILQDTLNRLAQNTTTKIRNSSAYVVTVLFNTIMESKCEIYVDPYLNFLSASTSKVKAKEGDG